ncbi:MAG: PrsW family glutamic-type intramembrane protease [Candidatus Methanoperedens sp.]|nr:PrsW family glutamic-type intramembrane protease [Candidatus Methanoperedens sp.]MCZ7395348.1 PrsW family glutamic-type intramembrane protease [Candidatus Methanoperedens sp.]
MAENDKVIISIHKPGLREKLFFCFSGIIVSIPITLYVNVFSSHACFFLPAFSALCSTVLFTPFIEEFAKVYPLFYRHGETEKSIFTLGFLTGLGFGITEFVLYVFVEGAPVSVRLPAIFFHASSTSITAFGIATKRPASFYLIAVALHLLNNFSASTEFFWPGVFAALIITYFLSWYLYRKTSERIVN